MTAQLTTAVASRDRTAPAEGRHRHDSACFWDVEECRWQCLSYPVVPGLDAALDDVAASTPYHLGIRPADCCTDR